MRMLPDDLGRHVGGRAALVGEAEAVALGGEPEVHQLQVRRLGAAGHQQVLGLQVSA